jgi:hypothetical protein
MADLDAIKHLLERLQSGWVPQADAIEPAVPQVDALNWQWNFEGAGTIVPLGITYQTIDRQPRKTAGVLYMDEHMTYALTVEGLFLAVPLGRERGEIPGRLIPRFLRTTTLGAERLVLPSAPLRPLGAVPASQRGLELPYRRLGAPANLLHDRKVDQRTGQRLHLTSRYGKPPDCASAMVGEGGRGPP